jgi:signal transduction histidine kinase
VRTIAGVLLTIAALVALGAGWFVTGWRAVEREQAAVRAEPLVRARATATAMAAELGDRLENVRINESERPYYHYQNLFHDPRGAHQGQSVNPSPLVDRTGDPLIAVHFQIDPGGRVTVPPVNEDVPSLSNPENLDDNRAILVELRAAAPALALAPATSMETGTPSTTLAQAEPTEKPSRPPPADDKESPPLEKPVKKRKVGKEPPVKAAPIKKVESFDVGSYTQNAYSNQVYQQLQSESPEQMAPQQMAPQQMAPQQAARPAPQAKAPAPAPDPQRTAATNFFAGVTNPTASAPAPAPAPTPSRPRPRPRPTRPAAAPTPGAASGSTQVAVEIDPFDWRTVSVGGSLRLAALRRVQTPDGALTQGFLIDPEHVGAWLEERAGAELPTRLVVGGAPDGLVAAAVPGVDDAWFIEVDPAPALAAAEAKAAAVAAGFLRAYLPVAALGAALGALMVWLLARSERLARQRSQFAAAAAHELRTPLAGLQLYGEMLADGLGKPERAGDYARHIADEAGRLGRVVANVLGFTQLERGTLAVKAAPGDAGDAARAAAERSANALAHAGVRLELDLPDGGPLPARFDADGLARILQNLLDNAEKYTRGATDRRVRLAARAIDDQVEIAVVDHGPGVPRAAARALFRPFARAGGAPAGDKPAGLGLGLAMARTLARAMGGELSYRPTPGGGATFVVLLQTC